MNNIDNADITASETPAVSEKRIKLPAYITPKRIVWVAVIVAILALAYAYKGLFLAATVNGTPISRFAVIGEMEKTAGRQALDSLINRVLIENEAKNQKITITNEHLQDEIKKIEDQLAQHGGTLEETLEMEQITREELDDQIVLQLKAKQILGDKMRVSEEEIDQYLSDTGQTLEEGTEQEQRRIIKDSLEQDKFSREITAWIDETRNKASIKEFVSF